MTKGYLENSLPKEMQVGPLDQSILYISTDCLSDHSPPAPSKTAL